jgi:S-disulfanyl-L-cysteine oxidoreductase SoxD
MSAAAALRRASHAAAALLVLVLPACGDGREARDASEGAHAAPPSGVRAPAPAPARYAVGRRASAQEIAAWNIDVGPDGADLPPGRGTWAEGRATYAAKCASCHGARAEGVGQGPTGFPRLVGRDPREGFPFGQDFHHVKTIGNYWPHATTLFDYIRRAMPLTAPGTLTNDETYSLVAFLLGENEVVDRSARMDAAALRAVRMPARERFVRDDRTGGPVFR